MPEDLIKSLLFWQGWNDRATALVAIGLLVEFVIPPFLFVFARKDEIRRKKWRGRIEMVGAFFVLVGVIGEWKTGHNASAFASRAVVAATTRASAATTRAEESESQLSKYTNSEFLKSLPRMIEMDIPKLKVFGHQRVDLIVADAGYEPQQLANEILFGCRELNWECRVWQVKPGLSAELMPFPLSGVFVMNGSDKNTNLAAVELVKELHDAEFRWVKADL